MRDTSPEIEKRFCEMMMSKSGQERLKMGFSMFNLARKLALASTRMNNPTPSEDEIRKGLFSRFYREDFTPEDQEKILQKIGRVRRE